jgi:hypothetical protein
VTTFGPGDAGEIVDLTIAYTWALDTRRFEDLRAIFLPDATANFLGLESEGIEAIIGRISTALARFDTTQHLIGNHQVQVSGDEASCRCYLQAQHTRRGSQGDDNFTIAGVYEDRLERRPEGWRIRRRTLTELWQAGRRPSSGG